MHFPTYLLGLASLSIAAPTGNYRRGEGGALELDSVSDLTEKLPIGALGRRGTIADPVAGSVDDIYCSDLLKVHGQTDGDITCIDGHGDLVPFRAIKRRQEEGEGDEEEEAPEGPEGPEEQPEAPQAPEEPEAPQAPEAEEPEEAQASKGPEAPKASSVERRKENKAESKDAGNPLGGLTGGLLPGVLRRSGLGNLHGVTGGVGELTGGLTDVTSGLPNTGKLASDTLRRDVGGLDGITGSLGGVTKGLPDTSSLTSGALGRREIAGLDGITGGLDGVTKGLPDTSKLTSGALGRRFLNGGTVDSLAPATDGLGTATQGVGAALSAAKLASGTLRRDLDASGGVPDVKELRKQIADDDFFHGKGDSANVEDSPEQAAKEAAEEAAEEAHGSLLPGILRRVVADDDFTERANSITSDNGALAKPDEDSKESPFSSLQVIPGILRRDLASEIKPLAEGLKPALEPIPSIDTTKMAPGVLRRGEATDIEAATDDLTVGILESIPDLDRRAEKSSTDQNGNKASDVQANHKAAGSKADKKAPSKKADDKAAPEKSHSKATEKTSGKPKGGLLGLPVPGVL